jgi:hypothetical protein
MSPRLLSARSTAKLDSVSGGTNITITGTATDPVVNGLTDAEIKTAYEGNADTNAFTDAEKTLLGNQSGINTGDEPAASTTVVGVVELATTAETDAGADSTRAVTPGSLTNILSDVAANTAKVSANGSVTTHSDVTDAGSGAIITGAERTNLSNQSGVNTGDEPTATTTAEGVVELATTAETDAGVATDRAVTPASLTNVLADIAALLGSDPRFASVATPAALVADADDYDPGDAIIWRIESSGAVRTITGLAPTGGNTSSGQGRRGEIWNVGASLDVDIAHEDVGSTAANRFLISGGSTVSLAPNEKATVTYDPTSGRWRISTGAA